MGTRLAYGTNSTSARIVAYYSVITVAGSTKFTVSWTNSSTGDSAIVAACYEGSFTAPPLIKIRQPMKAVEQRKPVH